MAIDFEARKQEMLLELQKLSEECKTLLSRTDSFREDLLKVKTEEEAAMFDETHDLEEGLDIIRLF